jgi:hypothetical protein
MAYLAEINRANPGCFLFLIDHSGSMDEPIGGALGGVPDKRKEDAVTDAINLLLQNLCIKCAKSEGVRDYYDVGVIGYGGTVDFAFAGELEGQSLVPISRVANSPMRIESRTKGVPDGSGGFVDQVVKVPIWFEPLAYGGTPMCEAMGIAYQELQDWIAQHQNSYPPIVINITDGESTDGDPTSQAQAITSLSTRDGNVLLFNCHLSSQEASPIVFPDSEEDLPDEYALLLFNISSVLPDKLREAAREAEYEISDQARGFAFNADFMNLINFLEIGTRPSNLR